MDTMRISLPADIKAFVDQQIASGMYANAEDFIHDVIREHALKNWPQNDGEELAALLEEGLTSGVSERSAQQIFAETRAAYLSRQD